MFFYEKLLAYLKLWRVDNKMLDLLNTINLTFWENLVFFKFGFKKQFAFWNKKLQDMIYMESIFYIDY